MNKNIIFNYLSFWFLTLFNANINGCFRWTTALHDGVGGCADRIPRESKPANNAGITLRYNCEQNENLYE
jgi:hypothetical protein